MKTIKNKKLARFLLMKQLLKKYIENSGPLPDTSNNSALSSSDFLNGLVSFNISNKIKSEGCTYTIQEEIFFMVLDELSSKELITTDKNNKLVINLVKKERIAKEITELSKILRNHGLLPIEK